MKKRCFRVWHDQIADPRFIAVERDSGIPRPVALAMWWYAYDHASKAPQRGTVNGIDLDLAAKVVGAPVDQIVAVWAALNQNGLIAGGRIVDWEDTQMRRADMTSRALHIRPAVAAHPPARAGKDDSDRQQPPVDAGDQRLPRYPTPLTPPQMMTFEQFWAVYPHHEKRREAEVQWPQATKRISLADLLACVRRYVATKRPDENWMKAATFLANEWWRHYPDPATVPNKPVVARVDGG